MANPSIFYKEALYDMCKSLIEEDNSIIKSKDFDNMRHTEENLTQLILSYKQKMNPNMLYFIAGQTLMRVLYRVNKMDCDSYNAALCGTAMFEGFLFENHDEQDSSESKVKNE